MADPPSLDERHGQNGAGADSAEGGLRLRRARSRIGADVIDPERASLLQLVDDAGAEVVHAMSARYRADRAVVPVALDRHKLLGRVYFAIADPADAKQLAEGPCRGGHDRFRRIEIPELVVQAEEEALSLLAPAQRGLRDLSLGRRLRSSLREFLFFHDWIERHAIDATMAKTAAGTKRLRYVHAAERASRSSKPPIAVSAKA